MKKWPWGLEEKNLHREVEKGNLATVRKLLATRSVDVDTRDEGQSTALHCAASEGHVQLVDLLLKANAAVDAVDRFGSTPLYLASSNGHAQVVALLLKANATVDAVDRFKRTPLYLASSDGHAEVVELLLKANATVDVAAQFGRIPLHVASSQGHASVVELLLKAKATVDAADTDGCTPLHDASSNGHAEVIDLLVKANATVDVTNKRGQTPLHEACKWQHINAVCVLLESGANLHAKDEDGLAPFHSLITLKHIRVESETIDTVQALVVCGATWDAKCDEIVAAGKGWKEAPALALCIKVWTQELADDVRFSHVPIEVIRRGVESTQEYIDSLKSSVEIVLRRKICLVGPSCAGKTSFAKSITNEEPQLEHFDNRTIGIDHFPLRFEQVSAIKNDTKIHEVTFWDFAGQDAYQVAHSLFFSPRTLFLVFVDLEAFAVAFLQASIMSNLKKQETQLMGEFIERTVMQWIRMIVARQPDAEFVFTVTKEDLLQGNTITERLLKNTLLLKLKDLEATMQNMWQGLENAAPYCIVIVSPE